MCLVVLQTDWVTMNYVPFGEKALTMVVNLYQQTAHDMSVIQFNILHNIIEVCYSLLVSMLCKVNYSNNPVVSYRKIQQDATVYQNLLFRICMKLNMFRATHRPLSGA